MKPAVLLIFLTACSGPGVEVYAPPPCTTIEQVVVIENRAASCRDASCYQRIVEEVCGEVK